MSFWIGLLVGTVVTFLLVRWWYRTALASARSMRDFWHETAEQRGVELKAADAAEEATDAELARLRADLLAATEEKTRLNRRLDAAGGPS